MNRSIRSLPITISILILSILIPLAALANTTPFISSDFNDDGDLDLTDALHSQATSSSRSGSPGSVSRRRSGSHG